MIDVTLCNVAKMLSPLPVGFQFLDIRLDLDVGALFLLLV